MLVDVQQVIPLPEAAAYQVQVREKEQRGRQERAERYGIRRRFWQRLLARAVTKTPLHANISPSESSWVGTSAGMRGLAFNYVIGQHEGRVELYIGRGAEEADVNKRIFDRLHNHKEPIESLFGGELSWQRLDAKQGCRIAHPVSIGGWKSEEAEWPEIHDAMIEEMVRPERAMKPQIAALKSDFS